MTASVLPTRFTPDQDNKKAFTPGSVRMKAAISRMPGHDTCLGLASSFALPAKWDPRSPLNFRSRGGSMDPDEHLRRDIRTPGFNPRSRLPTPANRCSGRLATWESVTRYRGGTVPESHGVPATPLVSDMGPHPTARPCKERVQWAHRPRPLQPEFPPPRRGFATIRTTAPTRARYGSNEPRRR